MQIAARPARAFVSTLDRVVGSSANYWTAGVSDLVAALAFLVFGIYRFSGHPVTAVALVVVGFIVAGLLEYVLHRWILHGPPSVAKRGHLQHHADPRALVSAPLFMIAAIALAICGVLSLVLPTGIAAFLVFGLYAQYNYFAIVHHLQHRRGTVLTRVPYFQRLESLHHLHHHRQVVNFGISTTVWDRVFGTYVPTKKLAGNRAGRRHAPRSRAGSKPHPKGFAETR